jgi:hypothetical protein
MAVFQGSLQIRHAEFLRTYGSLGSYGNRQFEIDGFQMSRNLG